MEKEFKDQWVSVTQVAKKCRRPWSYTQEVLNASLTVEKDAEIPNIERTIREIPVIMYKIDPEGGEVVCPIDQKPYDESICKVIDEVTIPLIDLKHKIVDYVRRLRESKYPENKSCSCTSSSNSELGDELRLYPTPIGFDELIDMEYGFDDRVYDLDDSEFDPEEIERKCTAYSVDTLDKVKKIKIL